MANAACKGPYCYHHLSDGVDYHDDVTCPNGHDGPPDPHGLMGPFPKGAGMHSVQDDVEEFHRALEVPVGMSPAIRRPELRVALIREEAAETCAAIERGDLVEAIDGMCDVLCVIYGTACEFGVNLAPFWDEVHRTNLAKKGGPEAENGKRLKPEGWRPPQIARILAEVAR